MLTPMGVLEWPYTAGGGEVAPLQTKVIILRKTKFTTGKIWLAFSGTHTVGSQTPLLPHPPSNTSPLPETFTGPAPLHRPSTSPQSPGHTTVTVQWPHHGPLRPPAKGRGTGRTQRHKLPPAVERLAHRRRTRHERHEGDAVLPLCHGPRGHRRRSASGPVEPSAQPLITAVCSGKGTRGGDAVGMGGGHDQPLMTMGGGQGKGPGAMGACGDRGPWQWC